jgi:tetratricopeptide (TPR) repeat protein
MLLTVVYGREKQYDKAIKLIDELHAKFPRNFMLEMSKATFYGRAKKWDLATQTYRRIADKVSNHKDGYERMRMERVLYELANTQFQAQRFDEADKTFALVVAGEHATPNEKANSHLWMGRMSDTRNDRNRALQHYNAILKLQADPAIKSDAQRGIKRPFGRP